MRFDPNNHHNLQGRIMTKTTLKYAKTIKDYEVNIFGHTFTIPAGSHVSNTTAFGPDDNYRHWCLWSNVIESVTGTKNSMLAHDIEHRGINIPAEYCEPWQTEEASHESLHEAYMKLTLKEITQAPWKLEKALETIELLKNAVVELRHAIRLLPCEQYTAEMHDAMEASTKAIEAVGDIN